MTGHPEPFDVPVPDPTISATRELRMHPTYHEWGPDQLKEMQFDEQPGTEPPPTSVQFLYLQHYYTTGRRPEKLEGDPKARSVHKTVQACGTVDEQLAFLADEVAGLRHLYAGYAENFRLYATLLSKQLQAAEKDVRDLSSAAECTARLANPGLLALQKAR